MAEVLWLTRLLPAPAGVDEPVQSINPRLLPKPPQAQPGLKQKYKKEANPSEDSSKEAFLKEDANAAAALLPLEALPTMDDLPQAVPVWLEDPPLLGQSLLYQRALAPLRAQKAESGRVRVDEEQTVERYGRDLVACFRRTWPPITPVWCPVQEPQFDLVLAMDGGLSMRLWERLLPELRRVFAAAGAFRDLRILPLFDGQGQLRPMAQLCQPTRDRRQLLLLLSDCAGEHWWSGALRPVLEHWAAHLPFAVLQVLPRRMWERTALGLGEALSMSNSKPAAPVGRYQGRALRRFPRRRRKPELDAGTLLLPVLSCDPDSLQSWSGVVIGDPRLRIAGYRLVQPQPQAQATQTVSEGQDAPLEPLQQWQRFCELASPQGRELARLLAAAPVLTLPVMRLVKQALMTGDPTPVAMAEVLLGGLLRLIPRQSDPRHPYSSDALQFDFQYGLRDHLLGQNAQADTVAVMNAVSLLVQERWNRFAPDQSFQAYLQDPRVQAPDNLQGLQAFGRVMAAIVEQLGGRYKVFAQELRQGAQKEAAASGGEKTPFPRFQIGGSLPLNYGGYVERAADQEVYDLLHRGQSCCIFGPHQNGKSSLMVRVIQRLRAAGRLCTVIDLMLFGLTVTEEQWYAGIVKRLIQDFDLENRISYGHWRKQVDTRLSPEERFLEFIDRVLLPTTGDIPLVIFLDEVDMLQRLVFDPDRFLRLIIHLQEQRPNTGRHITFCLLGTISSKSLIRNSSDITFKIGPVVELPGFTRQEAIPLLAGLRGRVADPETTLDAVLHWSGGQPFLTQKLLDLLLSFPQRDQPPFAWVEKMVHEKVIENWEFEDIPPHLSTIRHRLLAGDAQSRVTLLHILRQVLIQPNGAPMEPTPQHHDLYLTGLVKQVKGRLLLANPIYGAVFTGLWVHQQLVEMGAETESLDVRSGPGKRFRVAFSFAGEKRKFVAEVAEILAIKFGHASILFDEFHEAEFARPDLAAYLSRIYTEESDLVVVVFGSNYQDKEWCGAEWRAVYRWCKENHFQKVILSTFGSIEGIEVPEGVAGLAGFINLQGMSPVQFAEIILERLAIHAGSLLDVKPKMERHQEARVNLYISCSIKDVKLSKQLIRALDLVQWEGMRVDICSRNDYQELSGAGLDETINTRLTTSDIILSLLSADYLASEFCNVELNKAKERHEAGEAILIPVILRPCDWQFSSLVQLQALPHNGKPITTWSRRDQAFFTVAQGIREVVAEQAELRKLRASTMNPDQMETVQAIRPSQQRPSRSRSTSILEYPEGVVPLGSPFYVPSSFEPLVKTELTKPGTLVRIKCPRGFGKSSLLLRLIAFARESGYRAAAIDLKLTDPKFFDNSVLFPQWFCTAVSQALDLNVRTEEIWDHTLGPYDNCIEFFQNNLLKPDQTPLMLTVDNLDFLYSHPNIAVEFIGFLRVCLERSHFKPLWMPLRLVTASSMDFSFHVEIHSSPFNVGIPVELKELQFKEVESLVGLHDLQLSEAELGQLLDLVGGHPFLVRMALYHLANGLSFATFLREAPTDGGVYRDHLQSILKVMHHQPELLQALRQVLNNREPVRLNSKEAYDLIGLGILVPKSLLVRPRCSLYATYFRDRFNR
ncbi:MAG: AAA-like domain-containing protein [Cyanobacteriota bacterium]